MSTTPRDAVGGSDANGQAPGGAGRGDGAAKTVQSVLAALRLLEEVAVTQPIGVSDLARRVDMPKSNVQRLLRTLERAGWVHRTSEAGTRWALTMRAFTVGGHAVAEHGLRDVARPVMEELLRATEETVHLVVPDGDSIVSVERFESPRAIRINQPLGGRGPLHATSTGKAILACLTADQVDELLRAGLERYTTATMTDRAALREELAQIRRDGYAANRGEWRDGVAAVAAAVELSPGHPIGALSISAPVARMPKKLQSLYGRMVAEAAARVTASLGATAVRL